MIVWSRLPNPAEDQLPKTIVTHKLSRLPITPAATTSAPRIAHLAFVLALGVVPPALADGTGWYSQAQIEPGRLEYGAACSTCHGAQLQGGGAPALTGRTFIAEWNGRTLKDLYTFVHTQMPLGQADSLKLQEYADIIAFLLAQNGLPAGNDRLTPSTPMDRVMTLAAVPTGGAPAAAAPPPAKLGELTGPVKKPSTGLPKQSELDNADTSTGSWLMYNKGYRAERYSTLKQIDTKTAQKLRPVCMFQLGEIGTFHSGLVVYDGILYATTHMGTYAIDATTCKKRWEHQHLAQGAEMNATNKGLAIAGGRVIRGTQDGFLYALDAKTGALLWERQVVDPGIGEGLGAAPIVWKNLVFMGKAGGDWGIRGAMMAFNVANGSPAWHFNTTPTGNEANADTWQESGTALHGGGAAWTSYALDRDTGTLYVPIGNPGPDYQSRMRPGDNLYTNSVVALDAKSGKLKWWYQLRPNDDHDWDTTVVSLFDAQKKKLLATAGKGGILHVLDRTTGKPEFTLPVTTTLNQHVPLTTEGVRVCPVAGVQWNGPAFSAKTGLLYVNAIDWCTLFKLGPDPTWVATVPYTGLANGWGTNDPWSKAHGWINAIDPATGKMQWRVKSPTPMYAALTPTAGGVLLTGDLNGNLLVLAAKDGKVLYSFNTGGPIAGGVITYEKKGKQYVAVATGNSGGSIPLTGSPTVVIFGL